MECIRIQGEGEVVEYEAGEQFGAQEREWERE